MGPGDVAISLMVMLLVFAAYGFVKLSDWLANRDQGGPAE